MSVTIDVFIKFKGSKKELIKILNEDFLVAVVLMMWSTPWRTDTASGRSNPCVSEITPILIFLLIYFGSRGYSKSTIIDLQDAKARRLKNFRS